MVKTPFWKASVGRWIERILMVGALVFVLYRLGPQLGALIGIGFESEPAPRFRFTALNGTHIDSDALRGSVVVLNFWATWCGPCRLEMPSLQSLHEDRAKDGVVVLGLATDVESGTAVTHFLREHDISYPIGMATSAHRQAFGGIALLPTTFLIDKRGIIRHKVEGYFAAPALRMAVDRLARE